MKKTVLFLLAGVLLYSCTPREAPNTFKDSRDGKVYKTVTIGSQVWMAENLAYLPFVVGPETRSDTDPCYYVYGYYGTDVTTAKTRSNYLTYGALYNWPAAMQGEPSSDANPSRVQGICPTGWHLPSDAEWTQLINYLGDANVVGGKLKATTHWESPNEGATNETGFTALPGGYYNTGGSFYLIGNFGYWWSSTEFNSKYAWYRYLEDKTSIVYRNEYFKDWGRSVRCVKD
ncbi:MAG: FISUMP domain-containing protein [Bacteroidales bacterium]|jgi:uncharacterized protein (TIGR02145 family)